MTTSSTGDERTRQPRRRKGTPEEQPPATQPATGAPTPAPSSAPGAGATRQRATSTRPRTRRPAPPATPAAQPATPAEPQPILPEEVVDEAAPLADRVPLLTPAVEGPREELGEELREEPAEAEPIEAEFTELEAHDEEAAGLTPAGEEPAGTDAGVAGGARPRGRRGRDRGAGSRGNALGALIEQRFGDPTSPVRSYSELERRSAISREALSRYVTPRADRRRSPTIDTLAAIADAMHLSLEQVCRAAVASSRGVTLPPESEQRARDEVVAPLVAALTEDQFSAVVELLRQMQPR